MILFVQMSVTQLKKIVVRFPCYAKNERMVILEMCELYNIFAKPCNTYRGKAHHFCTIVRKILIKVEKS